MNWLNVGTYILENATNASLNFLGGIKKRRKSTCRAKERLKCELVKYILENATNVFSSTELLQVVLRTNTFKLKMIS